MEVFRQLSWAVDNRSHRLTAWRHSPSLMGYQQCLPYEDQFGRSPVLTLDYKAYTISMVVDTGAVQSFVSEDLIGKMKKQYRNVTTSYRQSPSATASGLGHDNGYLIDGLTFNGMPVGRMKISGNKNDMYNLGMDFFSRFDNYLFVPDQMLFCYMIKRRCAISVFASISSGWKFSIINRRTWPATVCKMATCCVKSTAARSRRRRLAISARYWRILRPGN